MQLLPDPAQCGTGGGIVSHRVVCSWCKKEIRPGDPALPISHGICLACRDEVAGESQFDLKPRHLIERFAVDSGTIKSIGYENGACVVEFVSGHLYAYPMTAAEFEVFAAAESKGRYFNQAIKGKFAGEKLTGKCSQCGRVPAVIAAACEVCGGQVRAIDTTHKP